MPANRTVLALALAVGLAVAVRSANAQVVQLGRPDAVLSEAFSFVRGMRELRDGRVLVSDYIEQRVVVVDFARDETRDLLGEGAGPANVRLPMGLVPSRADSTFVIDYGNNRLIVLAPDGRAVRTIVLEAPGRLFTRGYDASGALVYAIPAWTEGPNALANDSVRVVRWRPPSDATTPVTTVQGTRYRVDRSPSMEPRIPIVGFAAQDAWVVSSDGAIVIVRSTPYRVDRVGADGRITSGPAQPVALRPVTLEDKRRFVREFSAASPISGRGPDGGMGRGPMPSASQIARQIETAEWATHHPPFDASGVLVAPDGRLWVRVRSDPSEPEAYDVFDRTGGRVQQVALPRGRRVALVTARGVYAVVESADGEQSIERYRLP